MSGFTSPNYTQIPNDFFDMVATMSEAELKITLIAMRQIFGFHKPTPEPISLSQFQQRTGLSRPAVLRGINEATERGVLQRHGQGKRVTSTYSIVVNTGNNLLLAQESTGKDLLLATGNNLLPTKEIEKEKEITTPPTTQQPEVVSEVKAPETKSDELLPVVDSKLSAEDYKQYIAVINQDFKLYKGRDMKLFHQLRGTSKQKGIKEYAFTDKPVDLAELRAFVAWYRRTYPNISLPQAPDKIASRVEEFRQSVYNRNPVTPMMPVNDPYKIEAEDIADIADIEAMVEAARKKIKGEAA